jgi:hypothetical protein
MTRIPFHQPAGLAYPEPPQEQISVSRRTRRGYGPTTADRHLARALGFRIPDAPSARTPILGPPWTDAGPDAGNSAISLTALLQTLAEPDVRQADLEDVQR